MYVVRYSCKTLVELLRLPLKKLLEIAFKFPREFLRGFFDAEGHVDVAVGNQFHLAVGAENSNKQLLSRAKQLLKSLGITLESHGNEKQDRSRRLEARRSR